MAMDFINAMNISASGLSAQRTRMNVVSMNLSNIHTTRSADGGPYQRRVPVFTAKPVGETFEDALAGKTGNESQGVQVTQIIRDNRDFKLVYDPSHPDADQFGYVSLPNINIMEEMVDMLTAKRSYEANVTAFNAVKNMALKTLDLIR